MVDTIFQAGGTLDCQDKAGATPLHWAADEGLASMCSTLINLNCNPHVLNKFGEPALHWAASAGASDAAVELIRSGCDIYKKCSREPASTSLELALTNGHIKTAAIMKHLYESAGMKGESMTMPNASRGQTTPTPDGPRIAEDMAARALF